MKTLAILLVLAALAAPISLAKGLEITEIDFNADYDDAYTYRVENRERISSGSVPAANGSKVSADLLPGSNFTLTIRIENTFNGEDPDLRGVFATATIEDIDDGADLDEKSIDFDLEPGDDMRVDIKFKIPMEVDAGTYSLVLEAEGEDRNDISYSTKLNLKMEVKKQSHDIRITRVFLNPSVLDCDRKARLTAEITNVGSNAESQMALEFKAPNLGINTADKDIFLESSDEAGDEENTHTKSLNMGVPAFFSEGTYPIMVNLYWKNFVLFDQKTAELTVRNCGTTITPVKETKKEQNNTKNKTTSQLSKETELHPNEEPVVSTEESAILASPLSVLMLSGGVFIIVLFALLIIGYYKKTMPQ